MGEECESNDSRNDMETTEKMDNGATTYGLYDNIAMHCSTTVDKILSEIK